MCDLEKCLVTIDDFKSFFLSFGTNEFKLRKMGEPYYYTVLDDGVILNVRKSCSDLYTVVRSKSFEFQGNELILFHAQMAAQHLIRATGKIGIYDICSWDELLDSQLNHSPSGRLAKQDMSKVCFEYDSYQDKRKDLVLRNVHNMSAFQEAVSLEIKEPTKFPYMGVTEKYALLRG